MMRDAPKTILDWEFYQLEKQKEEGILCWLAVVCTD